MESSTSRTEERNCEDVRKKLRFFTGCVWKEFKTQIQSLETTLNNGSPSVARQAGDIAAAGASVNPFKAGFGLVKQLYTSVQTKKTVNRAKKLPALINQYKNDKEEFKSLVVEGCIYIFQSFEMQFVCCYVDVDDNNRALDKLASDLVIKIINYVIKEEKKLLTPELMIKAMLSPPDNMLTQKQTEILYGAPLTRTVILPNKISNQKIKSANLYCGAGIVCEEEYYKTETSNTAIYGYRCLVTGELLSSAHDKESNQFIDYSYVLATINVKDTIKDILDYIKDISPDEMESRLRNDSNRILHKLDDLPTKDTLQELCGRNNDRTEKFKTIRFQMNDPVSNFVGRKNKIKEIHDYILSSNKIITIVGPPGIGKTETSRKYSEENIRYFQHFIWINSETDSDLKESIEGAATDLSICVFSEGAQRLTTSIVKDVYEKIKDVNSLVIFDNVISYNALKNYLPSETQRKNTNINVIITSQNKGWVPSQFQVIELGIFDDDEVKDLLEITLKQYEINIINRDIFLEFLKNELGNYPLALQQALAYVIEEAIKEINEDPVTEYIENYKSLLKKTYSILISSTEKIDSPFMDYYTNTYKNTVFVTMQMSFDRLGVLNEGNALKILQFCSFLNPESITKDLLYQVYEKKMINNALPSLKKYSLAEIGNEFVRIHRLVLEITRQLLHKESLIYQEAVTFALECNWLLCTWTHTSSYPNENVHSWFIFSNSAEFIKPLCSLFEQLTDARKCQLFLLLVYYNCLVAIKEIINSEKTIELTSYLHQDFINQAIGLNSYKEQNKKIYNYDVRYRGSATVVAFLKRHSELLGLLFDSGADINVIDDKKKHACSLLHVAAYKGCLDRTKLLLSKGANPNIKGIKESSDLHTPDDYRSIKYLKRIIDNKRFKLLPNSIQNRILLVCLTSDVIENTINWDKLINLDVSFIIKPSRMIETSDIMHRKQYYGKNTLNVRETLIYLIENGATICALEEFGEILHSISTGLGTNKAISICLLIRTSCIDDPFRLSSTCSNCEFARLVLKNDKTSKAKEELDLFLSNNKLKDKSYSKDYTPLHLASLKGHVDVMEELIEYGADINATTDKGWSILHVAASKQQTRAISLLADKEARPNTFNLDGYTALHLAVINGYSETLKLLINKKADIFAVTGNNDTVLHLAAARCNDEIISILIDAIKKSQITTQDRDRIKRFVDLKDKNGKTALQHAVIVQSLEIVKGLIHVGADVNEDDVDGMVLCRLAATESCEQLFNTNINATDMYDKTALMICAENDLGEKLTELLNVDNIEVNAVDEDGRTALIIASSNGHSGIIKLLINADKVNVNAIDKDDKTALMHASANGHHETIKVLLTVNLININAVDKYGNTALILASGNGYSKTVNHLINTGNVNVNIADEYGKTALILASSYDHSETVELLLKVNHINVNCVDKDGNSALICASAYDYTEIVKLLLGVDKIDVNLIDRDGKTALILAVEYGYTEIIKLLLNFAEINVNIMDTNGDTALMYVLKNYNMEAIKLLLNKDKIDINIVDKNGKTVLFYAFLNNKWDVVEHLLKVNNNLINTLDKNGRTILMLVCIYGNSETVKLVLTVDKSNINAVDNDGKTALMHASSSNWDNKIVKTLLDEDRSSINVVDKNGKSALMHASSYGRRQIVEFLLNIDKSNLLNVDINGKTALMHASSSRSIETVKLLITTDASNIKAVDKNGRTALMHGCLDSDSETVEFLLNFDKRNINAFDKTGKSALIHACSKGKTATVTILLNIAEINLNIVDIYGRSALHYSARNGRVSIVQQLINKGIKLDVKDKFGSTELHHAACRNNSAIFEILLDHQARVNAQNNKNKTALRISVDRGLIKNIKLLLDRGADPNIVDINGLSVLQIVVKSGKINTLKHLMDDDIFVDVTNRKGQSLLHIACIFGRLKIVKFLLNKGANINLKTNHNHTALNLAVENKHTKIETFLISKLLV